MKDVKEVIRKLKAKNASAFFFQGGVEIRNAQKYGLMKGSHETSGICSLCGEWSAYIDRVSGWCSEDECKEKYTKERKEAIEEFDRQKATKKLLNKYAKLKAENERLKARASK